MPHVPLATEGVQDDVSSLSKLQIICTIFHLKKSLVARFKVLVARGLGESLGEKSYWFRDEVLFESLGHRLSFGIQ